MPTDSALRIGVDVGGTNLRVGVVRGSTVIAQQRFQADFSQLCHTLPPERALEEILATLRRAIASVMDHHVGIAGIGIGFPGFVVAGKVAQSPNLPGLRNVDLATPLQAQFGIKVVVENDALAAAYGEFRLHAGTGAGLLYLGLGTGVGGGLIVGGSPYPGEHGVAMEVGHLIVAPDGRLCGCGNRGCLEQYASATGISKTYQEATGTQYSAAQIAERAEAGDQNALRAYTLAGEALAQAVAHILKVVDVGSVVIGGGVSAAWPLLQQSFSARLEQDLIPVLRGRVAIIPSQSGDRAGMIGAALLGDSA